MFTEIGCLDGHPIHLQRISKKPSINPNTFFSCAVNLQNDNFQCHSINLYFFYCTLEYFFSSSSSFSEPFSVAKKLVLKNAFGLHKRLIHGINGVNKCKEQHFKKKTQFNKIAHRDVIMELTIMAYYSEPTNETNF